MNQIKISESIISKLFPKELPTREELEKKYPPRNLPEGAMVTRLAPSPTGFIHIGSLYTALVSERLAKQTNGVFFLRIEDTDQEREIEGMTELITKSFDAFGIQNSEGLMVDGGEKGSYGPYAQSKRTDIYQSQVKFLLETGKAYPCFCSQEEINEINIKQEEEGIRPGYYGKWAKWRDASLEDIEKELERKTPFVIRFRSEGDFENKIKAHDVLKGNLELSENDQDRVILKSSTGLPTYHLAHVTDDHYMRTTHVLRGDEWLSSLPLHLQLFEALEWKAPEYGHLAPIQKIEGNSKRKLSKRKDAEANAMLYEEEGFPYEAIVEYLLNLANSTFEDWRKANLEKDNHEFQITLERLARSNGPLFDLVKLNDVSKEIISRMTASEIYTRGVSWAKVYSQKIAKEMEKDAEYTKAALNIEREGFPRPRKDIGTWSDLHAEIGYFFDTIFEEKKTERAEALSLIQKEDIEQAVKAFLETYNENDIRDEWFEKIKKIGRELGYADGVKAYKLEPQKYKGQVGDIAKIFRILLSAKTNTPDLYSIMRVMGKERVIQRIKSV